MSTAADKLAQSRRVLIEQMHRRATTGRNEREPGQGADEQADDDSSAAGWFARIKRAATAWWRQHPASFGLELATPALSAYASKKPAQFLGIAAAVGALVVVARPWRLVSVTGLLVALFRSSQLSSLVMSAMSAAEKDHEPRQ